jgi:LysM repeat protein
MWSGAPISYTTSAGQVVKVARYEHTMILTGYTHTLVHVADAYTGLAQTYDIRTFLASWAVLDNQAVVYEGESVVITPKAVPGKSYTVQRGDYLSALAERFDVPWRDLAALNGIFYPYVIHPGQILLLPGGDGSVPQEPTVSTTPSPTPQSTLTTNPKPTQPPTKPVVSVTPTPTLTPTITLTPDQNGSIPESYVVQRGDYLVALARHFNLEWITIAEINGIPYPYTVYPGQVIRLR